MTNYSKMIELLSPAGNLTKLKYALHYGADAVYIGGKKFGLRQKADNFSPEQIKQAVEYTHHLNKKIYIAVNIYAHNQHLDEIKNFIKYLKMIKVDALIISDPGVVTIARKYAEEIPMHLSTQANCTNYESVKFWQKNGLQRIILARELSIAEIKEIRQKVPNIELEMFVHGAMCISYSGRCLLSNFLIQRNANLGDCAQPCRWKYSLVEETRPGQFFPILEDEYGTYILNSKDLCLINKISEILESGIDSIKIEGRMKSLYYTANVTRIYRDAVDNYYKNQHNYQSKNIYLDELEKVSHRQYYEGFYNGRPDKNAQNYESSGYIRNYQFLGELIGKKHGFYQFNIRAKFSIGDTIEFISQYLEDDFSWTVDKIYDEEQNEIEFTKPNTIALLKLNRKLSPFTIIRKKIDKC